MQDLIENYMRHKGLLNESIVASNINGKDYVTKEVRFIISIEGKRITVTLDSIKNRFREISEELMKLTNEEILKKGFRGELNLGVEQISVSDEAVGISMESTTNGAIRFKDFYTSRDYMYDRIKNYGFSVFEIFDESKDNRSWYDRDLKSLDAKPLNPTYGMNTAEVISKAFVEDVRILNNNIAVVKVKSKVN